MSESDGPPLRIVHLREFAAKNLERDLVLRADGSLDVYPHIETSGYVSFEISSEGVRVRAGQFVGVIPINGRLAIRVVPRIPLQHLTQMVSDLDLELRQVVAMRHYGDSLNRARWMTDALTDAFLDSLHGLRDRGIQREYLQRQDISAFPHGRIRLTETARLWARREKHKAAVTWFERSPQTPYNEVLKAAVIFCLGEYSNADIRGRADNRHRIRRLSAAMRTFEDVHVRNHHEIMSLATSVSRSPIPSTLDHYRRPLNLAEKLLLMRGLDLESSEGIEISTSMLVNMGDLFEKYIRTALQRACHEDQWPLTVLDGNLADVKVPMYAEAPPDDLLLAPTRPPPANADGLGTAMTPDLVLRSLDGDTMLVGDVKNKLAGEMPKRDDVEQVVAYAVRFGVDKALIVYPKNTVHTPGLQAVGKVGSVSIFQYHFDLDTEDVGASKTEFVESVRRLALT